MCTRLFGLQQLESVFACRENQGMHMTEEQLPCLHLRTLLWGMHHVRYPRYSGILRIGAYCCPKNQERDGCLKVYRCLKVKGA